MSHFLDRLTYFSQPASLLRRPRPGHRRGPHLGGRLPRRWQHDKIVRSTHGVNCTGSCSWKIYVKGGIVTWETQQTDYPRTRRDMPNHEPRGCARGAPTAGICTAPTGSSTRWCAAACSSSGARRARRSARSSLGLIVEDDAKRSDYQQVRGLGGFVRVDLGRSQRDHRRGQRLHRQDAWSRPRHRLFADPGDVDGVATPRASATCR